MKIPLVSTDKFVIVDPDDYEKFRGVRLYLDRYGYASTGRGTLHRMILQLPKNEGIVDHINRDKLDCRKSNLRICSKKENTWNMGVSCKSTTKLKGVCFDKSRNKFVAHISINNKSKKIGRFSSALEAALAYDKFAKELRGDFAFLNFPERLP